MSARQRLGFAAIAVAIALLAVMLLGGEDASEPTTDGEPVPSATATMTPAPEQARPGPTRPRPRQPRVSRIAVRAGQPVGGVQELGLRRGDRVGLLVTSDAPDEVHVHGYDLLEDVGPGRPASFDFRASITGVFEVELEAAGVPVASLRVQP